jgi:hypothetical protein
VKIRTVNLVMRAAIRSTGFLDVAQRPDAVGLVAASAITGTVDATCMAVGAPVHREASTMGVGAAGSTPRKRKPSGGASAI